MRAEYLSQSITHAVVAACVVQVLVRLWRVRDPDLRVAFRLLPLAFPVLVLPAFLVLAPWRAGEAFRDGAALFAAARWSSVAIGTVEVGGVVFGALVLAGFALLLVDLARIVAGRRTAIPELPPMPAPETAALVDEVETLARALGARPPAVAALDTPEPVLHVRGLRRPVLAVSRGALDRLDARERRAALAHELVHVARRDAVTAWALLACRVALAFNPAAQVAARAAARELEWRADEIAARVGDRQALLSALVKLGRTGSRAPAPARWTVGCAAGEIVRRGRQAAAARRRQRLQEAGEPVGSELGALRLASTSVGLVLLLFFVV